MALLKAAIPKLDAPVEKVICTAAESLVNDVPSKTSNTPDIPPTDRKLLFTWNWTYPSIADKRKIFSLGDTPATLASITILTATALKSRGDLPEPKRPPRPTYVKPTEQKRHRT